jgi:hypothetical protein
MHEFVNHTQKEYARGDVHEHRAECLCSLLKPYLRVFRGLSKTHLFEYLGFLQCLRYFRQQNAREQASVSLRHGSDAWSAEVVAGTERLDRLQTGQKWGVSLA